MTTTPAEMDALLREIRGGPHAHSITEVQITPAVPSGAYREFRIAF